MLFKTLSASVYGIDAYVVEVEVDVGSSRSRQFAGLAARTRSDRVGCWVSKNAAISQVSGFAVAGRPFPQAYCSRLCLTLLIDSVSNCVLPIMRPSTAQFGSQ
jgi:hypothetical protein